MLTPQLSAPVRPPSPAVPAAEVLPLPRVSARWAPAVCDALAMLVAAAGRLDLHDTGAVAHLREAAHRITAQLVALGRLPAHLVVGPDDPDVVVVRTLAAAWRRSVPDSGEQGMPPEVPSRETINGHDRPRTASSFDGLYDALVAAWHARFAAHEADRALADRVAAEERYRAARSAVRAWLEWDRPSPPARLSAGQLVAALGPRQVAMSILDDAAGDGASRTPATASEMVRNSR